MTRTPLTKIFWRSSIAFILCVLLSLAGGLVIGYLDNRYWSNISWPGLLAIALIPLIFPSLIIFIAYFLLYPRLKRVINRPVVVSIFFLAAMLVVLFLIELSSVTFTIERYLRNNGYFIIFSFFTAIAVPILYRRTKISAKL